MIPEYLFGIETKYMENTTQKSQMIKVNEVNFHS